MSLQASSIIDCSASASDDALGTGGALFVDGNSASVLLADRSQLARNHASGEGSGPPLGPANDAENL